MHKVEPWASEQRKRFVYGRTRPVSICSVVDAATREAAIAGGEGDGALG
jgi:hypothetical protein